MILLLLISLLIIGIIQTIGLILRYLTIKDPTVPYAYGIKQYVLLYLMFFVILGVILKLTGSNDLLQEVPISYIAIAGPLMAMRYMYVCYFLPSSHPDYV